MHQIPPRQRPGRSRRDDTTDPAALDRRGNKPPAHAAARGPTRDRAWTARDALASPALRFPRIATTWSSQVTANVVGNRPAALTLTEDQGMNRRVRLTARLGRDIDVTNGTRGLGNRQAVVAQAFDMKLNGIANLTFDFLGTGPCSDAARKIGYISGVVCRSFLDHDGVTHGFSSLPTGLLPNAVQRSSSKLVTRLAWHSYAAALRRVLELTMASACGHQEPTVVGKQAKHLADLHRTDYGLDRGEYSNRGLTLKVTGAPR